MLLATKSPLCPTSVSLHGPGLFENAFPLVHLAPPIHPLKDSSLGTFYQAY